MPSGLPATALASVGALSKGGEFCEAGGVKGLGETLSVSFAPLSGCGTLSVPDCPAERGGVKGGGGGGLIFGKSLSKPSISFGGSKEGF